MTSGLIPAFGILSLWISVPGGMLANHRAVLSRVGAAKRVPLRLQSCVIVAPRPILSGKPGWARKHLGLDLLSDRQRHGGVRRLACMPTMPVNLSAKAESPESLNYRLRCSAKSCARHTCFCDRFLSAKICCQRRRSSDGIVNDRLVASLLSLLHHCERRILREEKRKTIV